MNYFNSFVLSWADKVTTGTWNLLYVIVNVGTWLLTSSSIIKQFSDKVKIRLLSLNFNYFWLINVISRGLQKLLKWFNGTIILTSFVPSFHVVLTISVL